MYEKQELVNPLYRLAQVIDREGKIVVIKYAMTGNGITASTKNMFNAKEYSGTMAEIENTHMLVPYYLMYKKESI